MYNNCQELFTAINSCPKEAKKYLEAVQTCFKRNLVVIMDGSDDLVITGYSANRKNARIKR